MKEEMFVMIDEPGRLINKVLPVRAGAMQHDEESSPSANTNLQLFEIQPPLAQAEVLSPPPRPPPVKPMVPRRILPHTETNFHTAQPLVEHPQSTPNTLIRLSLENRVWQSSEMYQGTPSQPLGVDRWEIS